MALQVRRGTSSAWSAENPTLGSGEPGFDTTLQRLKFGDGVTAWNSLPFIGRQMSAFAIALLDDANAEEARSSLSLGTAAVEPASAFAAASHSHPQSDVTNLTTDLAGKAATGHNHSGVYEPALGNPATNGHVLSSTTGGTRSWIAAPDPWTTIRLASDFVTNSASAVDVTGLFFTPTANKRYEFYVMLLTRTATATVGPRPGLAWPTGMTDGVGRIRMPSSGTAELLLNGNVNTAMLAAVGGLPNNTQSYMSTIEGMIIAGASPSGNLRIQLASETAGTNVTVKAGSFLRWREIP